MIELKRKVTIVLFTFLSSSIVFGQSIPFGSGDSLNYGIDLAESVEEQKKLNSDVIKFYDKWKGDKDGIELVTEPKALGDGFLAKYETANEDKPMYVIKSDVTGSGPVQWREDNPKDNPLYSISSSEATGYGMLIFAYMAGYDDNAQRYFDGLLNTYLNNLSGTTVIGEEPLRTMSWALPNSLTNRDGTNYARTTSATDGDFDIAYALLLASKQWNTPSMYADTNLSYLDLAQLLIQDIKMYLIDSNTKRVYLGDWQYESNEYGDTVTRPSDWMISHLRAFYSVDTDLDRDIWLEAIDEIYRILPIVDTNSLGLVPDFVEDIDGVPSPVEKDKTDGSWIYDGKLDTWIQKYYFLEGPKDDQYDNNSCRVPWRMATDYVLNGGAAPKFYLDRINTWSVSLPKRKIRVDWSSPDWASIEGDGFTWSIYPGHVNSGYYLDGISKHGTVEDLDEKDPWVDYHFAMPIGLAHVAGTLENSKDYLEMAWTATAKAFGGDNTNKDGGFTNYFGDSITLMNMILVSGNWWTPYPLEKWTIGICYEIGDEVIYNGLVYECVYPDVSLPGREPDNPVMWAVWECKQN